MPTATPPATPTDSADVLVDLRVRSELGSVIGFFADNYGIAPPELAVRPSAGAPSIFLTGSSRRPPAPVLYINSDLPGFSLGATLAHLYARVVQHHLTAFTHEPAWMPEAAATYAAGLYAAAVQGRSSDEIRNGWLRSSAGATTPLDALGAGGAFYGAERGSALGALAVDWLVGYAAARSGSDAGRAHPWGVPLIQQAAQDAHIEYYRLLPRSRNWEAAFEAAFGIRPDDFYVGFALDHRAALGLWEAAGGSLDRFRSDFHAYREAAQTSLAHLRDHAVGPTVVFIGDVPDEPRAAVRERVGSVYRFLTEHLGAEPYEYSIYVAADARSALPRYYGLARQGELVGDYRCLAGSELVTFYVLTCEQELDHLTLVRDAVDVLSRGTGGTPPPRWLLSGILSYVEAAYGEWIGIRPDRFDVEQASAALRPPVPLRQLETGEGWTAVGSDTSRALSLLAVDRLVQHAGERSLMEFYRLWSRGEPKLPVYDPRAGTWEAAFERAFGLTLDGFYEAFEPTPPPDPTPAPEPGPPPAAAPDAIGELIEPAPGAFEHRTFAPGELIEWWHGIFFMDTATGRVEGYRVAEEASRRESYRGLAYPDPDREQAFVFSAAYGVLGSGNRWVEVTREDEAVRFLLDRASGRSWRLGGHLDLRGASGDRLLWLVAGTAVVSDQEFAEVARPGRLPGAHLSADGRRVLFTDRAVSAAGKFEQVGPVCAWDIVTSERTLLLGPQAHEQWGEPVAVSAWPGPGAETIRVEVRYRRPPGASWYAREWYDLSWEGEVLARAASPGRRSSERPSPDLGYVAWPEPGYGSVWPAVAVADGEGGKPLLRVRSADFPDLGATWLASGDGLVLWGAAGAGPLDDRTVIARIRPQPVLERLPTLPEGLVHWPPMREAMVTGTAGSDRFFAGRYQLRGAGSMEEARDGVALYDTLSGRWHLADIRRYQPESDAWGDPLFYLYPFWPDHAGERELAMVVATHRFRGGGPIFLNRTALELTPFSEELAFRVARTGSCLRVREGPGEGRAIVDCLPDGTRVVLARGPFLPGESWLEWVHVRTDTGVEGWVAHRFLDHD
ncbi:MAG: SH3 domain-containing protein [Chloroflexi bacterium]|nr:SH3 domain-containing protein [Chloroflexota bacterium]